MSRGERRYRTTKKQAERLAAPEAAWLYKPRSIKYYGHRITKIKGRLKRHNICGTWNRQNNEQGEGRHEWELKKARVHKELAEA